MPAVYPRPRGGTYDPMRQFTGTRGLSPPTRGNPFRMATISAFGRSIPAHAGEPLNLHRRTPDAAVYPRPRGGTQTRTRYST